MLSSNILQHVIKFLSKETIPLTQKSLQGQGQNEDDCKIRIKQLISLHAIIEESYCINCYVIRV